MDKTDSRICIHCRRPLVRHGESLKRYNQRVYCDRACRKAAQKKRESNPPSLSGSGGVGQMIDWPPHKFNDEPDV